MICPTYLSPKFFIFSDQVPALLYYSHLPAIIISLLIGFFVYFKGGRTLPSRVLLAMSISFSIWTFLNLITWTNNDSSTIMFVWSLLGIFYALIYIFSFYFVFTFISKSDISFKIKAFLGIILFPIIALTPTKFNLYKFNLDVCGINEEGKYFVDYYYLLGLIVFLLILFFSVKFYRKSTKEFKQQIILLNTGISFFLLSFVMTESLASYLVEKGYVGDFGLQQYGLFGMIIFMGFLAYLIVQYHAFKIKLLGAQALVVSLNLLVGFQFFYAQTTTAYVLTGVTLLLSLIFGYILIKVVKRDDERKEELQLMADKLAAANDQLRKLDNAKTEFISIASHQLRTPITAIKGFASLLLEGSYGELSETVHGAMEKVYDSAERLVSLIEDLLNVSRIESGRMQFEFTPSKVDKLLHELYDNFLLIAKTKKFYLDLKLPETLPEIVMDYSKIRELVSNFIDNALKYTEKGGVTIKAEIKDEGVVIDDKGFVIDGEKSPYGKVVRISVSDTGIGIPHDEIPYLFKKFSRGKDVSRLHVGGTGLGLYVGKAIADAHHGQVWVESDGEGKGSRFMIEIPLERRD